jgi:hypothetical protein
MKSNKSFIEQMNGVNFGKKAMIYSIVGILISFLIKLFYVPTIEKHFEEEGFKKFKLFVSIIEYMAIFNIAIFFICIIAFKEKIGFTLIRTMQTNHKEAHTKWIRLWLKSILVCIIILGITTFITHTLFKSWIAYLFLVGLLLLPFLLKNKLQALQQRRY